YCDCKYICGFTYPTNQPNQFGKCKWTTNDPNSLTHECKGMVQNDSFIVYVNELQNNQFLIELDSVNYLSYDKYIESGELALKASQNDKLREFINRTIRKLTEQKGFVV
ncbi:16622_t:CDS:2, partial [Racocetra persica]